MSKTPLHYLKNTHIYLHYIKQNALFISKLKKGFNQQKTSDRLFEKNLFLLERQKTSVKTSRKTRCTLYFWRACQLFWLASHIGCPALHLIQSRNLCFSIWMHHHMDRNEMNAFLGWREIFCHAKGTIACTGVLGAFWISLQQRHTRLGWCSSDSRLLCDWYQKQKRYDCEFDILSWWRAE